MWLRWGSIMALAFALSAGLVMPTALHAQARSEPAIPGTVTDAVTLGRPLADDPLPMTHCG